jgi:hypothetical protein
MESMQSWCALFGIPLTTAVGSRLWRLDNVHGDARGVRLRFVTGSHHVMVRLDPLDVGRRAYAVSKSVSISHGALPQVVAKSALQLVSGVAAAVVSTDRGHLAAEIERVRRGFSATDAVYVEAILKRLPAADNRAAARFIEAVVTCVNNEEVPVWVVEPSFRAGERSFRLSVNATLRNAGEHGHHTDVRHAVQTWRRLCVAAGLPAVVPEAQVDSWVRRADHHAYVGVTYGGKKQRSKLYFHAPEHAFLSFVSILPVFGFNSALLGDAHMICADFDPESATFDVIKSYDEAGDEDVLCVRRSGSGKVLDRSRHCRVTMNGPQVQAWLTEHGDPDLGGFVRQLVDEGLVVPRIVSNGPRPTVYTAIVREALPSVES